MASCSDYFRAMFSHDMLESKSDQLELPAIHSSGFEPLLNYAYSGKLKLNLLNIGDVLATSSFLQVTFAMFRFDLCHFWLQLKNISLRINIHPGFNFHSISFKDAFPNQQFEFVISTPCVWLAPLELNAWHLFKPADDTGLGQRGNELLKVEPHQSLIFYYFIHCSSRGLLTCAKNIWSAKCHLEMQTNS